MNKALTPEELSKRWAELGVSVSVQTLSVWRKRGIGPAWFKPNSLRQGRVYYWISDVERYEKNQGMREKTND